MREQLDLGVEAPARLGAVDGLEMSSQVEVGHDARRDVPQLRGGHEQRAGAPRAVLQHRGDAVVDPVLEEADVVVARAVVRERGLDHGLVGGAEQGRQGPA